MVAQKEQVYLTCTWFQGVAFFVSNKTGVPYFGEKNVGSGFNEACQVLFLEGLFIWNDSKEQS